MKHKLTFHNASFQFVVKAIPSLVVECLRVHNFHLSINWKNKYTIIEPWSHYFQGGGGGSGGGLATFGGLLLSGFLSDHNFLTLLSGGRFFRNFTI